MNVVVDWNGEDIPEGLKSLPAGRYVVESVDDGEPLTDAEDEGLRFALASVAAGRAVSPEEAEQRLGSRVRP